jgi:Cof subfamily protein (haloacid dehalogenase superfamily)
MTMWPEPDTLYLSDLDGTLLGASAELSAYTIEKLNDLIRRGLRFSIATARTAVSATHVLSALDLAIPLVLMNGAQIYDLKTGHYLHVEYIPLHAVASVVDHMRMQGIAGFMYGLENDTLTTYYENLETEPLQAFHQERVEKYGKRFTQVDAFIDHGDRGILYFVMLDTHARLASTHAALSTVAGLAMSFYPDIYSADLWYLEVYSDQVSKGRAAMILRDRLGYGRLVGFGDNLNDLPLFEVCDESYAVGNAHRNLADVATASIGTNREDGVARWLDARFCEKR